ncbi:hypothetical protein [Nocardiopsis chromatogenes]|uniref:hypothetical protein n=1 Tax=Nocardiopsis chromatogenes TaxID=280239 RepID=UPI0003791485|nr:hypothetical protein [Nocardiopsis chromatogenes]
MRPDPTGEGSLRSLAVGWSGGKDLVSVVGEIRHVDRVGDGARAVFSTEDPVGPEGAPTGWSIPRDGGTRERVFSYDKPIDALTWHPSGRWVAVAVRRSIRVAPVAARLDPVEVARADYTPSTLHWA